MVIVPLAKVPEALLPGAVKVTVVLAINTGFPLASSTVALKGLVKAVPTVADWPVPPVATTWVAAPAMLVATKLPVVRPS